MELVDLAPYKFLHLSSFVLTFQLLNIAISSPWEYSYLNKS